MYAIETSGLTKCFDTKAVVEDICLKVPEGSIYGFIGPNGAGKTTTLNLLTGLISHTADEIKFFDKRVNFRDIDTRFDFGYLPDVPGFYEWMNAVEYLRFSGNLFSIQKKVLNDRIEMLLDMVGLEAVNKNISTYSRGMKQRLGIAQALIHNPKIVFLDEPVSALDPIGRMQVMDIIKKLAGKVTVFFSSHILSDVERICDRIAIIDKGKIKLEDSVVNIKNSFAMNQVEIEFNAGNISTLQDFFNNQEWLRNVEITKDGSVKLDVLDMKVAQNYIMKLALQEKLLFNKLVVSERGLEDVFMQVVSNNEQ